MNNHVCSSLPIHTSEFRRQVKAAMVMDFGWADLPDDLLCDIAMRLECMPDMLAFADVCSSWRAAYANLKSIWTPTLPWLILTENNDDNPLCIRTVVDLNTNKRYHMKLPETFGRHCWGCEDGWIFTLGLDMEIHLFNPLTKARLSLPSALTLPFETHDIKFINYHDPRHKDLLRREYIQKAHVVSIPPNDELLVMVIYNEDACAFAKPGDSKWISLLEHCDERRPVLNVITCGPYIAALFEGGALQIFRPDTFLRLDGWCFSTPVYLSKLELLFDISLSYFYLVDCFGDLLVVLRYADDCEEVENDEGTYEPVYIDDPTISYETYGFEVCIFDFGKKDWVRLRDLGECSLFVGNNSAIPVYASECGNCKPNCIYFTDERPSEYSTKFIGHDMGIYNMKDKSIERVYLGVDILSEFCPPFWFMPKLV